MQDKQSLTSSQTQKDQIKSINQKLRDFSISLTSSSQSAQKRKDVSLDEIKSTVCQAEGMFTSLTKNRTHQSKFFNENRNPTKKQVRFSLQDEPRSYQTFDYFDIGNAKNTPESSESNLIRNIATYNQMISVYVNAFQLQVWQQKGKTTLMEKKDIWKRQSQNGFLDKIAYLSKAFKVFIEIQQSKGIFPDTFTISQLLRGLKILAQSQIFSMQNSQQVNQAHKHLISIGNHLMYVVTKYNQSIDDIILNSFMDLCVKFKIADRAISVYETVQRRTSQPKFGSKSNETITDNESFNFSGLRQPQFSSNYDSDQSESEDMSQNKAIQMGILIKVYGQLGRLDEAFHVFSKCQAQNSNGKYLNNDITFGCLIDACVKNGYIHKAEEIFDKILKDDQLRTKDGSIGITPNTVIYTTMIKAYSRTFQLDKALEIYNIMIGKFDGEKCQDCVPNIITYNSIIDCCVRCGEMMKATEIFQYMQSKNQEMIEKISQLQENQQILADQDELKDKVDRYVATQNDPSVSCVSPDLITFSTLIKGHCRVKNIEQALILHEQMLQQGIKADEVLYNSLLDGCLKSDETEMALKCYKNMKKLKIKASNVTYSILAKIYQKMGDIEKALNILEEMKSEGVKAGVFVYTCMIQTCLQAFRVDQALEMYNLMLSEGIAPDNVTYYTIIQGCLVQDRQDTALDFLLETLQKNTQIMAQNFLAADSKRHQLAEFQFAPKQLQILYNLIKSILVDENNKTAIKRYNDVEFILREMEKQIYCNQNSQKFHRAADKENAFAYNQRKQVKNMTQHFGSLLSTPLNNAYLQAPHQAILTSNVLTDVNNYDYQPNQFQQEENGSQKTTLLTPLQMPNSFYQAGYMQDQSVPFTSTLFAGDQFI